MTVHTSPDPELEKNSLFIVEEMLKMEKVGENLWKDKLGYASLDRNEVHTLPKSGVRAYKINWYNEEQGKAMEKLNNPETPQVVETPALPAPEGDVVAAPAEDTTSA